ncbi:MAG: hypothetical protein HPKKFMNG_00155 [Planctomycetes bacterium]|nr:hypothetical protein [Planctomycetota bacterium]HRJ77238.1 hypothetical protein [Planctomycetota bacterium]
MRKILPLLPLCFLIAACGPEDEEEPGGAAIKVTINSPTPEPLTPANAAIEPAVAYDGSRVHLVYAQSNGSGSHDVVYTSALVGGAFVAPATLLVSATDDSRKPQCALDSLGTLHVVWEEGNAPNREVYYATRTSGGTITTSNLTNTAGSDESSPRVHVDSNNRVHVVWESGGNVYYRRKIISFGSAIPLPHVTGGSNAESPDVCTDVSDRVYVLWSEQVSGRRNLRLLRSDDNGSNFGQVSTDGLAVRGSVSMTEPRVKGGLDGEVFLAFIGQDAGGDRGLYSTYTRNGGSVFATPNGLYTSSTGGIRQPSIAVFRRPDNNYSVFIAANDGTLLGGNILAFASRDNGERFKGGPHELSKTFCQANTCTFPVLALDADDCVAAWMGQPGAGGVVRTFMQVNKYELP